MGILLSLLFWGVIIYFIVRAVSGRKRKHYKWLAQELPLWEQNNIISKEQADAILKRYNLKRIGLKKKMDFVKILILIGSIFVGMGIIFFVASNWQKIPNLIKTTMLLSITIFTLYAGYIFSYEKEGYANLGKSLLLLASLLWGGSIALIGQIYHIPTSQNWYIMLLWAFPIVPIAVFFKNEYVHLLAPVLFIIWNFLYSASYNIANYYYPIIVFGLMLPIAQTSVLRRRINILGLVTASLYCCFFKYDWLSLFISIGLLAYYFIKNKERDYLYGASVSFICWAITYFTVRQLEPNSYFFLPLAALFYLTYKHKIKGNLVICIIGTVIWLNLTVNSFSRIFIYDFNYLTFLLLQSFLGIACYAVGMVSRNREYAFVVIYKIFGYMVTFICTYLLAFQALLSEFSGIENSVYFYACMFLMIAASILVISQIMKGYFRNKADSLQIVALIVVLIGNLILLLNPAKMTINTVTANSVLVVFAVINILLGVELHKPSIFNLGIVSFILFIITRYIDVVWKLQQKSFFFIIGGIIILTLGVFFEKQRRKIIERMKSE